MGSLRQVKDDQANSDRDSADSGGKSPKRKKPRGRSWLWIVGVVILAGGATVYAVPVLDRLEEQRTEIAESTAELEVLVAQNTDLKDRLDALNTPVEIERLARERLGYVREGETAFVVVPPREESVVSSEGQPVAETETVGDDPWYRQWWSYISGSDLTADS